MIVRRLRPVLSGLAFALLLTGCAWGTGLNAETAHEPASIHGVSATAGPLQLHNLMVVPALGSSGATGAGYLLGTVANAGDAPAELVTVTSPAGTVTVAAAATTASLVAPQPTATPSPTSSATPRTARRSPAPAKSAAPPASGLPVRLLPGTTLQFGAPGTGLTGPSVLIQGAAVLATPGTSVSVTFTFGDGTSVSALVPVNQDPGTTVVASPVPSDSTPPSPAPTPFLLSPSSEIQPTTAPPTP